MSENETGDDQDRGSSRPGRSGLSLPREDAGARSTGPRSRREAGVYEKLRRAGQMDESTAARWFIPLTALVVIVLVAGIAAYRSQSNTLTALENEVAALRVQMEDSDNTDLASRIDRLLARVEGLGARLDSMENLNSELQALRRTVTEHTDSLEALNGRLEELEQASAESGRSQADSAQGDAAGSEAGPAAEQPGDGEWVVNLITVSDRTSAESVKKRLGDMGIASQIVPITREGKSLLRVVVPGFESRGEAEAAAPGFKQRLDLPGDPWIARR